MNESDATNETPVPQPEAPVEPTPIDRYLSATVAHQQQEKDRKDAAKAEVDNERLDIFRDRLSTRYGWDLLSAFTVTLASPTQVRLESTGYRPILVTLAGMFECQVGESRFTDLPQALKAAKK